MSGKHLARIITSFEGRPWPFGLSAAKLRERAYVVEPTPEDPTDRIVFELERHRGLLGERYVPGSPMRNFATEVRRYAFDPVTETIRECDRQVTDVQVDAAGVVDTFTETGVAFLVDQTADGYTVREVVSGREATVQSEAECCRWARQLPTEWDLSALLDEVRPFLDDDEWHTLRSRVLSGCQAAVEERVRRAWARHVGRSS